MRKTRPPGCSTSRGWCKSIIRRCCTRCSRCSPKRWKLLRRSKGLNCSRSRTLDRTRSKRRTFLVSSKKSAARKSTTTCARPTRLVESPSSLPSPPSTTSLKASTKRSRCCENSMKKRARTAHPFTTPGSMPRAMGRSSATLTWTRQLCPLLCSCM